MPKLILMILIASLTFGSGTAVAADKLKLKYVRAVYLDSTGGSLRSPEGVACTDDTLWVADSGSKRLLQYKYDPSGLQAVSEIPLGQASPVVVQTNSKGTVYALDGRDREILVVDPSGRSRGALKPTGVPGSQKIVPRSIKVDSRDVLHVLDIFSERVLALDENGKFLKEIAFPEDYGFFSDLAIDNSGNLFLLDSVNATVYAAKKNSAEFLQITGQLEGEMNFPISLAPDNKGKLLLVDQYGSGIVVLNMDGSSLGRRLGMGWSEGSLYYPAQVCISPSGTLFIADRSNNRVQQFSLE